MLVGPGDDAAVLVAADGRVVASTDSFVDGRHFRRDWSTGTDIGRKCAAQAMADITAMGARPTGVLLALACPSQLPVRWTDEFAAGLRAECDRAGAVLLGGDVVASDALVITVTALGDLVGRSAVRRDGARAGQVVAVTGRLGFSAAGFAVLSRGFRSPAALVSAHRVPEPPYRQGPAAAEYGATAMCDVSDGLVADLGHIATTSGVRIELARRALPIPDKLVDIGNALGVDPLDWILHGGEDHALVATFPAQAPLPDGWTAIGSVADGEPAVLLDGAVRVPAGFEHFPAPR